MIAYDQNCDSSSIHQDCGQSSTQQDSSQSSSQQDFGQLSSHIKRFLADSVHLFQGKLQRVFFKYCGRSNVLDSEEMFMSKLRLGFSKLGENQLEEISQMMASQLSLQDQHINEMVWSSKCLLEAGFIIFAFLETNIRDDP